MGMQQANEGMKNLKGLHSQEDSVIFTLSENDAGEMEAEILGHELTADDIDEKHRQLEQVKGFNFFSSIGTLISESFHAIFDQIISIAIKAINSVI
jgi:hypothetical protein